MSAVATRLRKLVAKRPSGLCALSDEELGARIDAIMAALLAEYGSVDAIAASFAQTVTSPPRVLWRDVIFDPAVRAA